MVAFDNVLEISYPKDMCIICVDIAKGKLTTKEARRALGEMADTLDKQHLAEVERQIAEEEKKAGQTTP